MISMRLSEVEQVTGGRLSGEDVVFSSVSIDTRSIKRGDLFVAIKGDNFDGNQFVTYAESEGAVAAIVSKYAQTNLPQVIVENTRSALGQLAKSWRRNSGAIVIGVTGSNGKTTVKEMIASIIQCQNSVLWTQGNFNNEIGVPLTLFRLHDHHRYAVIELGANHLGEIATISGIAQPDIGVITNAGSAHIEGFGSLQGVARGKGELIDNVGDHGSIILNRDDVFFPEWKDRAGYRRTITFGLNAAADVRAINVCQGNNGAGALTGFDLVYKNFCFPIELNLSGCHNVSNALAAAAVCFALGLNSSDIQQGLASMKAVSGRLQFTEGAEGALLIDDSYNANPSSYAAALDVLVNCGREPWVILGELSELGEQTEEFHAQVAAQAKQKGVAQLFAIGANGKVSADAFGVDGFYFDSKVSLVQFLKKRLHAGVVILVKGSRSARLETVVEALKARGACH